MHGLALQPPLHRAIGRLGGFAGFGGLGVKVQRFIKPRPRIHAVGFLRAVFLGFEDEHAFEREAAVARFEPALLDVVGQGGTRHIEAQLDGTRDLIDVLPTRTLRSDGAQLDFTVVDVKGVFHGLAITAADP